MVRIVRGFGSLAITVGLLIGVPFVLVTIAGWPLPTAMPNWDNVYWSARQGNIPAEFVIKSLACVVWLAWAQIAWAIVWEVSVNVPALAAGRRRRSSPLTAAPLARLAHQLVASILVIGSVGPTAATVTAPSLHSLMSPSGVTAAPVALVATDGTSTTTTTAAAATAPTPTVQSYVVVSNDTLWDIAQRCLGDGGRVDEIIACNPNLSPTRRLRAGQTIALPASARVPTPVRADSSRPTPVRIVTTGDTLWEIVEDHYGTVDANIVAAVAAANEIADPALIYPGQEVKLPALDAVTTSMPNLPGADPHVHVVVSGDDLWSIVEDRYGAVDADIVAEIAAANEIENPSLIHPGQRIELPDRPIVTQRVEPGREADSALPSPATPPGSNDAPPSKAVEDPAIETGETNPTPGVMGQAEPATAGGEGAPDHRDSNVADPRPAAANPVESIAASSGERASGRASVHERSQFASARWLFGGGAVVTSLGLVGAWMTLQRLRRRRRRWLDLPDPPTAQPGRDADSPTAQSTVDCLAALVCNERPLGIGATAVVIADDEVEVLLEHPDKLTAPPGWSVTATGWCHPRTAPAPVPILSSAVVTLGTTASGDEVAVDLVTAGSVSVTGDRAAVEHLICSMLWELASDPLDVGTLVDIVVVGLACVSPYDVAHPAALMTLDDAVELANERRPPNAGPQVFLVDPFDDPAAGRLTELVDVCAAGSGRCVVVAGPCGQPGAEVHVPNHGLARWEQFTLTPPQLPEDVDARLAATLAAVTVGRRELPLANSPAASFDPEAEAVALRSVATLDVDPTGETADGWAASSPLGATTDVADDGNSPPPPHPELVDPAITDTPAVWLRTTGREVTIVGLDEAITPPEQAVAFLLAVANREMHVNEISDLTGYSIKTLANAITSSHPLIERATGTLRLREPLVIDHEWATRCVRELASAIETNRPDDIDRWYLTGFGALRLVEQGPYAVLPTRERSRRAQPRPWDWIDEFPADVPARPRAETDIAEAALAYSELWASVDCHMVRASDVVGVLCRLATLVPFAAVTRNVRPSSWSSGAECLLEAAARIARNDSALRTRVHRTARDMVARQQIEASDELADALDL